MKKEQIKNLEKRTEVSVDTHYTGECLGYDVDLALETISEPDEEWKVKIYNPITGKVIGKEKLRAGQKTIIQFNRLEDVYNNTDDEDKKQNVIDRLESWFGGE